MEEADRVSRTQANSPEQHAASGVLPVDLETILFKFNSTASPYPRDRAIHELFEFEVRRAPDSIALIFEEQTLTYRELDRRANQVATALPAGDIQAERCIGLYTERSVEMVVCMLAILKAGAAYVPLDPSYPSERLAFMCHDCSISTVVTTAYWADKIALPAVQVLVVDELSLRKDERAERLGVTSRNLAYVMYTSGSTGRPKGVMVEHRSVVRLVMDVSYAQISPGDCVAHCASPSFDAATWEIWGALLNGARLLIVPQRVLLSPVNFNRLLLSNSVSVMWLTIGLFSRYVDSLEQAFSQLRYLLTGGDVLAPAVAMQALRKARPPQHLINAYGPTETTTFATTYEVTLQDADAGSLPIGRPISNTQVHILDESGAPVPIGSPGEIYIGGPGVARGYRNQPRLNAERFVPDFFNGSAEAKLYRSGDMGRWRPDGCIEFLGRRDSQVKIRGFRVELGEVEAVLQRCPSVKQAAVVAREDEPGEKRLVGYVVPALGNMTDISDETGQSIDGSSASQIFLATRAFLTQWLPQYLLPAVLVILNEMPLSPNGKVDRNRLPAPDGLQTKKNYEPAETPVEKELAAIWMQLLNVSQIGVRDNFFELGGDSLLGLELISKIADTFDVKGCSALVIYDFPTIREMAKFIETAS